MLVRATEPFHRFWINSQPFHVVFAGDGGCLRLAGTTKCTQIHRRNFECHENMFTNPKTIVI